MLQCSAIKQPVEPLNNPERTHDGCEIIKVKPAAPPKKIMTFHTVAPRHPDIGVFIYLCINIKTDIHT